MEQTRKVLVFYGPKDIRLEEFPIPELEQNQCLIRVDACAICTWEQRVYQGKKNVRYPFTGGHEVAGTIEKIGSGVNSHVFHIGDHVAVGLTTACGDCFYCKSGNQHLCEHPNYHNSAIGLPYKGMSGLGSYLITTPDKLFHYENIEPEEASLIEPLSCVVRSIKEAQVHPGDVAVVLGSGVMGLLHVQLLAQQGVMVFVSDRNPTRREQALRFGAFLAVDPDNDDLTEVLKEKTNGHMADIVFDTKPVSSVIQKAMSLLAKGGKLMLFSSVGDEEPISFMPNWLHSGGYCLMGTANSSATDFLTAARLASGKKIDLKTLVSEIYCPEKAREAFESACRGNKYRVVIRF